VKSRLRRLVGDMNSVDQYTDEQMARLNLKRHRFHGDWNYTFRPCG
jgi:hypothetical protein